MLKILKQVEITYRSGRIVDTVLANPEKFGF
jgi:hypothetical protein